MVTLSESRELLLILALIGGFAGAFLFFDASTSLSVNAPFDAAQGKPPHSPLVANPVVHIDVPAHNIFEPN